MLSRFFNHRQEERQKEAELKTQSSNVIVSEENAVDIEENKYLTLFKNEYNKVSLGLNPNNHEQASNLFQKLIDASMITDENISEVFSRLLDLINFYLDLQDKRNLVSTLIALPKALATVFKEYKEKLPEFAITLTFYENYAHFNRNGAGDYFKTLAQNLHDKNFKITNVFLAIEELMKGCLNVKKFKDIDKEHAKKVFEIILNKYREKLEKFFPLLTFYEAYFQVCFKKPKLELTIHPQTKEIIQNLSNPLTITDENVNDVFENFEALVDYYDALLAESNEGTLAAVREVISMTVRHYSTLKGFDEHLQSQIKNRYSSNEMINSILKSIKEEKNNKTSMNGPHFWSNDSSSNMPGWIKAKTASIQ